MIARDVHTHTHTHVNIDAPQVIMLMYFNQEITFYEKLMETIWFLVESLDYLEPIAELIFIAEMKINPRKPG